MSARDIIRSELPFPNERGAPPLMIILAVVIVILLIAIIYMLYEMFDVFRLVIDHLLEPLTDTLKRLGLRP